MRTATTGILILFLFSSASSFSSPGPGGLSINYNLADKFGILALKQYCLKLMPRLTLLSLEDRENTVLTESRGACFVILDEFASGTGPVVRYFFNDHPYTKQFIHGPGFRWALDQSVFGTDCNNILVRPKNLFYSFSPLPLKPKTWRFAITQHHQTLKQKNLPQFILGSFSIRVDTLTNDLTRFTITNYMSRRSLFLHTGPKVQRPLPLGTTRQVITIVLSKEEILAMLYP